MGRGRRFGRGGQNNPGAPPNQPRESVKSFGADFNNRPRGNRGRRYHNNFSTQIQHKDVPGARISIRNYGNATIDTVLLWLQEEAKKLNSELSIFETEIDPPTRTYNLKVAEVDVPKIKQICESTPFHGQNLEVRLLAAVPKPQEAILEATFTNLLEANYNPQTKVLDLSNLSSRINTNLDWSNPQTSHALCNAMSRRCTGCTELRLDANGISSLMGLKGLVRVCPTLLVLSLTNNKISEWKQLQGLSGLRLKSINLSGNPVKTSFDDKSYQEEILNYFPGVMFIDGLEKKPLMRLQLPPQLLLDTLPQIYPSFIGTPELADFTKGIIAFVYEAFDRPIKDAEKLRTCYADGSFFSVTFSENLRQQLQLNLKGWAQHDRNFAESRRVSTTKLVQTLAKGKQEVIKKMVELPPTQTDMNTLVCDAFPIVGISTAPLVCVIVYGSLKTEGLELSFNRSFVVRPGPPTEIINDQLNMTAFNGTHLAYNTAAISDVSQQQFVAAPIANAPHVSHDELIARLMSETRLNNQFAIQALQNNEWDYLKALANFNELRAANSIPPEAFTN